MLILKQTLTFITGIGCGSGMLWSRLLGDLGIAKHQGLHTFLQIITHNISVLGELNVLNTSEEKNVVVTCNMHVSCSNLLRRLLYFAQWFTSSVPQNKSSFKKLISLLRAIFMEDYSLSSKFSTSAIFRLLSQKTTESSLLWHFNITLKNVQ